MEKKKDNKELSLLKLVLVETKHQKWDVVPEYIVLFYIKSAQLL